MALLGREAEVLMQGKAASFDCVDDYVDCGSDESLDLTDFTFEAWIKANDISDYPYIISKGDWGSSSGGYHFQIYPDGKVNVGTSQAGAYQETRSGSGVIVTGEWIHLVATKSGDRVRIYKNGMETSYSLIGNHVDPAGFDRNLYIAIYGGTSNKFDGVIDEVRVYNRALTPEEVQEHYQGIYRDESGLVLYLPFENDAEDYSGQGNHGINYGAIFTDGVFIPIGYARSVRIGMDASLIKIYNIESDEPDVLESAEKSFTVSIERMYIDRRLAKNYLLEKRPFTLHVKPAGSGAGLELIKLLDVHLTSYSLSIEQNGLILDSVEGEASDLIFTTQ